MIQWNLVQTSNRNEDVYTVGNKVICKEEIFKVNTYLIL